MVNPDNNLYVFGPYTLNAREGILLQNGQRVPLQPKVFETLLILVRRHGHFVGKDELMQLIWPDTFVEEINLAKNISILRKTLANTENAREFIETLPKRGYRFALPVEIIDQTDQTIPGDGQTAAGRQDAPAPHSDQPDKTSKYRLPVLGALLLAILGMLGFYAIRQGRNPLRSSPSPLNLQISRVTNSSQVFDAAISPDGHWLAFILGERGRQSLWFKDLETSEEKQLLPQFDGRFRGVNFSPDSRFIYFGRREKNNFEHILYRLPREGGEPQAIMEGVDSTISFAPDGLRFAFVREDQVRGESVLIIAGIDGRIERNLAIHRSHEFYSVDGPAWSPDGKLIAVALGSSADKLHYRIMLIRCEDGYEEPLGKQQWAWAMRVQWLRNQSGVILAGREKTGGTNNQIWRVTWPAGIAHRIVNDIHDYRNLSLTADGETMATIQSEVRSNIWAAPINPSGKAGDFNRITSTPTSQSGYNGLDWTPDGRIVYISYANDQRNLWIIQADGSRSRQLTFDMVDNERPSVSGDGQFIAFTSKRSGALNIWRIDPDGGIPKKLTNGGIDLKPACSPDGSWVVYSSERSGRRAIWKISNSGIEGGPARSLTEKLTDFPTISPDGKLIACVYQETSDSPRRIALLPFEGGAPLRLLDIPVFPHPTVRWHPSGKALAFLDPKDDFTNIWLQTLDNSPPVRVTNFDYEGIFDYAWSRDGRLLAVSRGVINRDVVIIRGFN